MKHKRIVVCVIILLMIMGSWVFNMLYFQQMQLKEPLFLKHHMIVNSNHGEMLFVNFLENKQAGKKVTGIQFADFPQVQFQIYRDQIYTHHVMMKAAADMKLSDDDLKGKLPITINELMVFYNEGPPALVPIGEIRIEKDTGMGVVDLVSASGSSDGSGSYTVRITQQASLEQIVYAFNDQLKPWFDLKLSGEPINKSRFPMSLRQGDDLKLTHQWSIPDDARAAYEIFRSKIQLHFRTQNDRAVIVHVPINLNFHLTDSQVRHLVQTRGEVE